MYSGYGRIVLGLDTKFLRRLVSQLLLLLESNRCFVLARVTLLIKVILVSSLATLARDFAMCPVFVCNYLQVFLSQGCSVNAPY